jgi:hypothetical protein
LRLKTALLSALQVLEPQLSQGEGTEAGARVLVSTKEERELEELLDMWVRDAGRGGGR